MEERDRGRVAAVLAADAELEVGLDRASALGPERHELADALLIDRLERVLLEHAVLEVDREEPVLGVVAREADGRLREVVRAEAEEVGRLGELGGAQRRARQLDHRADQVVERLAGRLELLRHGLLDERAHPPQLLPVGDERDHDLDLRLLGVPARRERAAHDRAHLHHVDLGVHEREAAPARAEHRVRLVQLADARVDALEPVVLGARRRPLELDGERDGVGQELVQRRVEQPDRDRQARHRAQDALEVGLLHRQETLERRLAALLVARHDHLADDRQALLRHEHVLGAAEPDALGAEAACALGVLGRVGVGADAQAPPLVRPGADREEVLRDDGGDERDRAEDQLAGAAVDRDHVALADDHVADRERAVLLVDARRLDARDAGLAHAARDDRCVRGHAAVRGHDALRLQEPVDVVGRGLPADQDDLLAREAAALGGVGVEDGGTRGCAGRGVQAARERLVGGAGIDPRVQQRVELVRVDPSHGLVAVDHALALELARDPDGGRRRALAGPRLQQVERPALDGELDVLHVAVVPLEPLDRLDELVVGLRQLLGHACDRLRRADAGDDVLALGVAQELAVEDALARRRIAREADARARRCLRGCRRPSGRC